MSSLATITDLEARLGRSVTNPEQAQAALDDVSAAVRAYTGQLFTRLTTSDRLTCRRGLVRLPQRPVNDVISVELANGIAVAFEWLPGTDRLCVAGWESCCSRVDTVMVTYDHGYDTIPGDIIAVVCNVTSRDLGTDPASGAVTQRSITNYQEAFGPIGASGPAGLFTSEAALLNRYRRVGTVAWVGVG